MRGLVVERRSPRTGAARVGDDTSLASKARAFLSAQDGCFWAAVGGALFWAASLLTRSFDSLAVGQSGRPLTATAILAIMLPTMGVMLALARRLTDPRGCRALAWGALGSTLACGVCSLVAALTAGAGPWYGLLLVLSGCSNALIILFWGVSFAMLKKEDAEKTVLFSMIAGFALFFLCSGVVPSPGLLFVALAMNCLALVPYLCRRYEMAPVRRTPVHAGPSGIEGFFAMRCLFGVGVGVATFIAVSAGARTAPCTPAWTLAMLGVLVAAFLWALRRPGSRSALLRVSPVLFLGVMMAPSLGGGAEWEAFLAAAPSVIWLCWTVLSSVQSSDIKWRLSWNEAELSFSEKTVVIALCLFSYLLMDNVTGAGLTGDLAAWLPYVLVVLVYVVIALTSYVLVRLVDTKREERVIDKALHLSDERSGAVYQEIAERYGLTGRERDVLELIAKGHTRPFICEELCISEGTARSHIRHVYQKCDIHSRDELFALVQDAERATLGQEMRG